MKTPEERLAWALDTCRLMKWRMTPVRRAMLAFLAGRRLPATLELIAGAGGVHGCCDATTVYRTLMMFKEAELVRLVGTAHRHSFFLLNTPGESGHFLICRHCGEIAELKLPPDLAERMSRISLGHGFAPTRQDHEIHGVCQKCQVRLQNKIVPAKLIA